MEDKILFFKYFLILFKLNRNTLFIHTHFKHTDKFQYLKGIMHVCKLLLLLLFKNNCHIPCHKYYIIISNLSNTQIVYGRRLKKKSSQP
jgi:hypothetical protein